MYPSVHVHVATKLLYIFLQVTQDQLCTSFLTKLSQNLRSLSCVLLQKVSIIVVAAEFLGRIKVRMVVLPELPPVLFLFRRPAPSLRLHILNDL